MGGSLKLLRFLIGGAFTAPFELFFKSNLSLPRFGAQPSAPRRGKDRSLLKYNSNGTVSTPPIRKWGVFEEETEGTFRRKI